MLVFLVYLGELLGTVSTVLISTLIMLAIIAFVTLMETRDDHSEATGGILHVWYSRFHKLVKSFIIILLLFVCVPSQKTFYVMVAVYAGTVVVESPEAKRIFDKAVSALERKLDSLADTAEPKTEAK